MGPIAQSSWLLSALLQSGATIVAIVGGFLGARYVSEHGNQSAAAFEVARALRDEDAARRRVVTGSRFVDRNRVSRLMTDPRALRAILEGNVPERILVNGARVASPAHRDSYLESLRSRTRKLIAAADSLRDELAADFNWSHPAPPWREARRHLDVGARGPDYAAVHRRVYLEAARQHVHVSLDHKVAVDNLEVEIDDADARWRIHAREVFERYAADLRERRAEESEATATREDAERVLGHMRSGEGFALGLGVLGLVATLTLVPSAALLVAGREYYATGVLLAITLAFAAGLLLLGRFLVAYSRFLRGTLDSLPASAWHLVPGAWFRWSKEHTRAAEAVVGPSSMDRRTTVSLRGLRLTPVRGAADDE